MTHCIVLGLKEMSVILTDNILAEHYQYPFRFFMDLFLTIWSPKLSYLHLTKLLMGFCWLFRMFGNVDKYVGVSSTSGDFICIFIYFLNSKMFNFSLFYEGHIKTFTMPS